MTATKIPLSESEMPRRWYNLVADLPTPLPGAALLQSTRGVPGGPAQAEHAVPQAFYNAAAGIRRLTTEPARASGARRSRSRIAR